MKKIYWSNSYSIQELTEKVTRVKTIIQAIVDRFSEIGVKVENINQLAGLVDNNRRLIDANLRDLVFEQLFPETPAGLNRERFREIAELPDLSNFVETFEPLTGYLGGMGIADVVNWEAYSIHEGKVEINKAEFEKLKGKFQEVAETEEEINRLKAVNAVCAALNNLVDLASDSPGNYSIKGVTEYDETSGKVVPGWLFVKNGNITTASFYGSGRKPESLKSSPKGGSGRLSITADTPEAERAGALAKARN